MNVVDVDPSHSAGLVGGVWIPGACATAASNVDQHEKREVSLTKTAIKNQKCDMCMCRYRYLLHIYIHT